MRKILVGAAGVVLVAMMYGCATTEQSLRAKGMVPQTHQELEARFSKPVKLRFDNNVGGRGTVAYTPDGSGRIEFPGGSDTGKWRVKDSKICVTWTKLRDGQEACFTSYKTGPKDYMSFNADGTLNATTTEID